jgi:hypothetical protein
VLCLPPSYLLANMRQPIPRTLAVLLIVYAAASLLHFIHNAEYLADYPNLPASWMRADIYLAWLAITLVGAAGWCLLAYGKRIAGLLSIAGYALLGMDSLGHYIVAPVSAHTAAMNLTILLEVSAAAVVFGYTMKLLAQRICLGKLSEQS